MNFVVVVVGFFFFKQKTAYEMRISDWSSDVCSSDLRIADLLAGLGLPAATAQRRPLHMLMIDNAPGPLWAHCFDASEKPRVDRKSVVSGKSVSVRVDLGGRRIIQKKTRKHNDKYVLS